MASDPRTSAPESGVGSGDTTPSGPGGATSPGPAEAVTPEVDGEGAVANDTPAAAPAEEEQEPEASRGHLAALAEKALKAEEYLGLAQRTKADFENYRRRAVRDAAAAQERGAVKLATALLPAIDNLDRALAHAGSGAEAENGAATFVAGIEHVRADVIEALRRVGIEPYSPEGQPFDPQYHEAVAQQPVEGTAPGTVVEVFQRGYRMGEHILRPARVVVAG